MRVLIVTNMYPTPANPGWGSFVASQVESLAAKGIEADLLVIEGHKSRLAYLLAYPRLWRLLASGRFDLIHAHYGLSGLVARAQRRLPLVVSFCGDDLYGHADARGRPTTTSRFWVLLHRLLASRVDAVIVKSTAMRHLLPAAAARSTHVIPNGVDLGLFRPMDRQDCRSRLSLHADRHYILFPYAPERARKNFGLVAAAVERLNASGGQRFELLVIQGRPNAEMPLFMNAADAVVLASYWEGSPNIVKEALACGTRIVASDVGDVRELIGGLPGCAICALDPESLATALARVLDEDGALERRARVAALSLDLVAGRLTALYAGLLRNNDLSRRKTTMEAVRPRH